MQLDVLKHLALRTSRSRAGSPPTRSKRSTPAPTRCACASGHVARSRCSGASGSSTKACASTGAGALPTAAGRGFCEVDERVRAAPAAFTPTSPARSTANGRSTTRGSRQAAEES